MPMKKKYLSITMPDGSKWGVPVDMIARSRAEHYASEFDGDVDKSLAEDTGPLFESDAYEIEDWAANNMNWSDFDGHQIKLENAPLQDFRDGWANGDKELVEVPEPMSDEAFAQAVVHGEFPGMRA